MCSSLSLLFVVHSLSLSTTTSLPTHSTPSAPPTLNTPLHTQVVKGQIWTFEQTQAFFFDVFTPVRMTVIKLKSGGLWVHCPVAPTQVICGGVCVCVCWVTQRAKDKSKICAHICHHRQSAIVYLPNLVTATRSYAAHDTLPFNRNPHISRPLAHTQTHRSA